MTPTTGSDLNRKISMAKSFLDLTQLLERTTNQRNAASQEEAKSKADDTRFGRKMAAHFLYTVVIELCIKIIWEVEHNRSPKTNHDILSRYIELSPESKQAISDMYDTQVKNTNHIISLANSGIRDNHGDIVNLCPQLQSLEDALTSNQETIKNFKYDGKLDQKSSVLCSMIWNDGEIFILSKPELIVFPTLLLEYAISLNGQ